MLIDYEAVLLEDEAFVTNSASGAIDLYGAAIAEYPSSNVDKVKARGAGSPLVIRGAIKRGGTGTTAMGGTFAVTVYVDDTDGATTAVSVHTISGAQAKQDGAFFEVFVPSFAEGRYLGIDVDDTNLTGGGTANVVDAFVFAL